LQALNTSNANNFYTAQRGQDLTSLQLGANLVNQGQTGQTTSGQTVVNTGQTAQNSQAAMLEKLNALLLPYTQQGNSSTSSTAGGGTPGAVGGALTAAQIMAWLEKNLK